MGTLTAVYLIGWAALSAYAGWMAVQNRRLTRRVDELRRLHQVTLASVRPYSKAG